MQSVTEKNYVWTIRSAAPEGLPQDLADRITSEMYVLLPGTCGSCGAKRVRLCGDHTTSCVPCTDPRGAFAILPSGRRYPGVVVRVDGRDAVRAIVASHEFLRRGRVVERSFLLVNAGAASWEVLLGSRAAENSTERLRRLSSNLTRQALGLMVHDGIWAYPDRRRLDGQGLLPFSPFEVVEQFCEQVGVEDHAAGRT